MAKIKWNDLAASQLENHLDYVRQGPVPLVPGSNGSFKRKSLKNLHF